MIEHKEMLSETSKKADKVLVRVGFSDVLLTREENERFNGHVELGSSIECNHCEKLPETSAYVVGYEDENGIECDEHGNYI